MIAHSTNSRRSGSKGQLSHTFAFLMAIIVIIATVILAMKLLGVFTDTACDASTGEFFNSIDKSLTANSAYGSRKSIEISAACGGLELCMVDSRDIGKTISVAHPEILVAVREGVEANIFLFDSDGLLERTYDERVILTRPDEAPTMKALCVDVLGGGFAFRTEGFGRYIKLSNLTVTTP